MAVIYNTHGTAALKAADRGFEVIDCRKYRGIAHTSRRAIKDALLFQDERLFEESARPSCTSSKKVINPVLLGVVSTAVTLALCLISSVL